MHLCGASQIDKTKRMIVTGFYIAPIITTENGLVVPPVEARHTRLPVRNAAEQKICEQPSAGV